MDPEAINYDPDAEKEDGSCKYEETEARAPSEYSFSDARLKPGRIRIELLDRLVKEVSKGENGSSIQLQDLYDPYRNNGVAGSGTIDLESILSVSDSARFDELLQEISTRSGTPSSMVGGHFVDPDSIAYIPLVKRGLMGASFFRYSTRTLLENLGAAANSDPKGSTTQREQLYDEAFSMFGVPKDLTRSTPFGTAPDYDRGAWFWGVSLIRTDSATGKLPSLFDAFVEGRWAITEQKEERRKDAVRRVERGWERVAAALMIRHIKRTIAAIDKKDLSERIHHWSLAHSIHHSLDANDDGIIAAKEHQAIRDRLGTSPNETGIPSLNDALAKLQNVYGFSNSTFQAL